MDGSSDQVDALWRYYDEQATQAGQHEKLRATVTGRLTGMAAAVFASRGSMASTRPTHRPAWSSSC